MPITNHNAAIAVTLNIFWVGFFDTEADLHCIPYLLVNHNVFSLEDI